MWLLRVKNSIFCVYPFPGLRNPIEYISSKKFTYAYVVVIITVLRGSRPQFSSFMSKRVEIVHPFPKSFQPSGER
jgi:hypothetical protein